MEIKQQFCQLCEMIYMSSDGFKFPFEDLNHDDDLSEIKNSNDYPVLESKMNNLLILLNKDMSNLDKDIETELWDLI